MTEPMPEFEHALIACALTDPEVYRRESAAHRLTAEMFEAAELGAVWRAIGVLLDRGDPIEPLSVGAVLADDAGMTVADLAALQGSVPATANASYYAGEIRKGHVRRALERLPDEVRESGLAPAAQAATLEVRARRWRELLAGGDNLLPEALTGAGWEAEAEPREWLVDGWLPVGELAMLAGPGSVGKSLLALQLGAALACDRDPLHATNKRQPVKVRDSVGWLPKGSAVDAEAPELYPEPVTVVLAGWEDTRNEALRRRERLMMYGGCGWAGDPSINDRLHVLPMRGYGPVWAPAAGGSRHIATLGELTETGRRLREHCEKHGARLLVLDPSSLALALDENNRALVSLALESWAGWATDSGCTVLLTAHPSKAKEGEGADYSGSTAWRGLVRALWTLRSPDEKEADPAAVERLKGNKARPETVALLTLNKNNYGWDGVSLTLVTCGGRAGWYLVDDRPPPPPKQAKGTNNTGRVAPARGGDLSAF